MRRQLLIALIMMVLLSCLSFAQTNTTDSLTITTYYPSPYGVYRNLKISPSNVPTAGLGEGLMYYDRGDHVLRYLNQSQWVNLTEGGGGGCRRVPFVKFTEPWQRNRFSECPDGYFTQPDNNTAITAGTMLCCRVENP